MILQKGIATIAAQKGVLKSTIDKDWALGHFIDAIYSLPELRQKLSEKVISAILLSLNTKSKKQIIEKI